MFIDGQLLPKIKEKLRPCLASLMVSHRVWLNLIDQDFYYIDLALHCADCRSEVWIVRIQAVGEIIP
jgi:hypothetical protein